MIETHYLPHDCKFIVTDERIAEYRDLMLIAASDTQNKYRKNYTIDVLSQSLFITLLCHKDTPIGTMALQNDGLPDNVARGFTRVYRKLDLDQEIDRGLSIGNMRKWREIDNYFYNFYNRFPHHREFGIDTIFFTRNFVSGKRNTMDRILKSVCAPYTRHPHVRIYKGTPQYFYVWGDETFLEDYPIYGDI